MLYVGPRCYSYWRFVFPSSRLVQSLGIKSIGVLKMIITFTDSTSGGDVISRFSAFHELLFCLFLFILMSNIKKILYA